MLLLIFLLRISHIIAISEDPPWEMHVIDNSSFGADGVRISDVNEDGRIELLVGWEQGDVVRLYSQPEDIKDDWSYVELPAPSVEDALLVDLDGDGFQDIVSFSEGDHKRITFHWAPDKAKQYKEARFWGSEDVPCTIGISQWMFGRALQVDKRNGVDIVVGAKNEGAMVGILLAPKDPRKTADWQLVPISQAGWIMSIETIDIDRDGWTDVLISDRKNEQSGVRWLRHPGKRIMKEKSYWENYIIGMERLNPMFLAYGYNDSGALQIWAPDSRENVYHFVQHNEEMINWKKTIAFSFPAFAGKIGKSNAIGDINLDGIEDVVTTFEGAEHKSGVVWSALDRDTGIWKHHDVSGKSGVKYDYALLVDMDNDRDLDILTCEENNNSNDTPGLGVIWYENPTIP